MNELLARILDAHGGMDRWNRCETVEATIVSGGGLFPLKGVGQDLSPRRMTVWLHEERSSVFPYGSPDQRTMFTPDRIAIESIPGAIETHNLIQDFFFGEDLMLRRHDYSVNIAGGFNAAQLTSDYVVADGIRLPTKRRAYTRGPDRRPILEMLMVSIDISNVRFET
jgi:hypothetical protein